MVLSLGGSSQVVEEGGSGEEGILSAQLGLLGLHRVGWEEGGWVEGYGSFSLEACSVG